MKQHCCAAAGCMLLCLALLVGCSPVQSRHRAADATITVGGSSAMEQIATRVLAAFTADTGIASTYTAGSSLEGVIGVQAGNFDFAFSSYLPEAEGLEAYVFAYESVCIVAHKDNPVQNLTLAQLRGIAEGSITNWAEVGGEDLPIAFVGRQAGSGARYAFEAAMGLEGKCAYGVVYEGAGALVTAVSMNPSAIGYASHVVHGDDLQAISVDGVYGNGQTIADSSYPFVQTLCILLKEEELRDETENAFARFIQTANIQGLVDTALVLDIGAEQAAG